MPTRPLAPSQLTTGPFLGSAAVARGLLTRNQLRSRAWRHLLRDVYVAAGLPDTLDLRAAAVSLVLPLGAVVSGTTAAWLHGADVRSWPLTLVVDVTVPAGLGLRRRSTLVRQTTLADTDVAHVHGVPVTTPLRTAVDLACQRDVVAATVAVDALMNRCGVTPAHFTAAVGDAGPRRWVTTARRVVDLAEPKSESPGETRLRLVLVLAGLPRPEAQFHLYDEHGGFVARLDLAYPAHRLGLEYDGANHDLRREQDAARRLLVEDVPGWRLRTYTAAHVFRHPQVVVGQAARLLGLPMPDLPRSWPCWPAAVRAA